MRDRLASEPAIVDLVADRPGLRLLGCVDAEEFVLRTVIAAGASPAEARDLLGAITRCRGQELESTTGNVTHLFPTANELRGDIDAAMPDETRTLLHKTSAAIDDGDLDLSAGCSPTRAREVLVELGLSDEAVAVIAGRALRDPDACPPRIEQGAHADVVERCRPFRAYAAAYLEGLDSSDLLVA